MFGKHNSLLGSRSLLLKRAACHVTVATQLYDLECCLAVAAFDLVEETLASPLFTAFLLVWEHYKADPVQASLGARLLGFFHLMVESRGTAVESWVAPSPAEESLVDLDSQVVQTLATMRLGDNGRLNTEQFFSALRSQRSSSRLRTPEGVRAWPAGNGELATMVRKHDWSSNPLGPVATWPQGLRTAVELVLACRFPMVVLWGPQLIQIYNDAYCNIMGRRHPAGLGQPTEECWPEVWHINRPIYERFCRERPSPLKMVSTPYAATITSKTPTSPCATARFGMKQERSRMLWSPSSKPRNVFGQNKISQRRAADNVQISMASSHQGKCVASEDQLRCR